jgi:CDP-glucose 4,6-dehydratase
MENLVSGWTGAFAGRRVLLTGHTGFKGGWLALWLRRLGAEVHGYALDPETPSVFTQAGVADALASDTRADLRDRARLAAAFAQARPELVLHLAAQPLVRLSYEQPLETLETNIIGTANVLDAARRVPGLRGVLVVTSDKCYENREWLWPYREDEPMGGADPYSVSKGCAELVTASFRRSYFQAPGSPLIASARAGNVFGGGDWAKDRLIPDIARAVLAGQPVVLRNPDAVRPWQHVLEPLRGYLMIAARLLAGDAAAARGWNFGPHPSSELPVGEVAAEMIRHWGRGALEIRRDPNAVHEARLLRLDSSQAAALLGWRPALDLPEALRLAVDWYGAASRLAELTQAQIAAYQERTTGRA